MKLTKIQQETMDYLYSKIDEARKQSANLENTDNKNKSILDAQNGVLYSPGGKCTIRTLKSLEEKGLIKILEDNSGIGLGGAGSFPSKVKVLNY